MPVTQDVQKEILKFLKKKIETDEMWAEAFGKLIALDEADQNGAVWSMLESVNDSMRWDELFARSPEKLQAMADAAQKSIEEGRTISLDEFLAETAEDCESGPRSIANDFTDKS